MATLHLASLNFEGAHLLRATGVALLLLVFILAGCSTLQRKLLFFPTHHGDGVGLTEWKVGGKTIGCAREVINPENVWLMLHGNAGQAADRAYAIPCFSARDAVFIMEYPGYGSRDGRPSKKSLDAAAAEAYSALRQRFPRRPVCVAAESIGSGPACTLAGQAQPPDKFVLVVPFDTLKSVAAEHVPYFPVSLILGVSWNNIATLSTYTGPVEIFGAAQDTVIPVSHAKNLAAQTKGATFHLIECGHNEWSMSDRVKFRNP